MAVKIKAEIRSSSKNPFTAIRKAVQEVGIKEARSILSKELEKLADEIKLALLRQTLDLAPLSPKYLAWKKRKGLDHRILIATGHYVSSIKVKRKNNQWEVGVPDGFHPTAGMTYEKLARIHEYGSKKMHIPARPHWRPTIAKFQARSQGIRDLIQTRVITLVNDKISNRLGKPTKQTKRQK